MASHEWRRPGTLPLLTELLDVHQLALVAGAYTLLESYERLCQLPWTELQPVLLHRNVVVVIAQVADRFAEAELVLRRALLDTKGQAAMEKTLARTSAPESSRRARLRNVWGSIPIGAQLAFLVTHAGARLAVALLDRRCSGSN